jgi:ribosomal protein L7/L12
MNIRTMTTHELDELAYKIVGEKLRREHLSIFHMVAKAYQNGKIAAIKCLKDVTGKGLLESKSIVEYWAESEGWGTVDQMFTVVKSQPSFL